MVETKIFQDAVFHSSKEFFFIVTFIMLILTCKLSTLQKTEAVPQNPLNIVQLNWGSYF